MALEDPHAGSPAPRSRHAQDRANKIGGRRPALLSRLFSPPGGPPLASVPIRTWRLDLPFMRQELPLNDTPLLAVTGAKTSHRLGSIPAAADSGSSFRSKLPTSGLSTSTVILYPFSTARMEISASLDGYVMPVADVWCPWRECAAIGYG
ncbi:hypothetical protein MAPG_09071 [Magnaporthiopsis poae ATCC 64411]|uniref:Uncharacterized protein n=1 Tax=Magnaporthiopsis poae (strain ATCC 64411 / 73-15) TaxID=644358 RepID=A0A0C4E8Z8_MAGP6|nr:hypothetical protein MAPG_09071 [Magnaporthiopsis poae ATCC 64411]